MRFDSDDPAIALIAIAFAVILFTARYVLAAAVRNALPLMRRTADRLKPETRIVRWAMRGEARLARRFPAAAAFVRRRLSPHRFGGLPLTTLMASAGLMALMFSEVTEEVLEGGEAEALDRAVLQTLSAFHDTLLLRAFAWLTQTADNTTLVVATGVAGALLWAQRQIPLALGLAVTVAGSQTMLWIAKFAIDRARPDFLAGVTAASPSFPSGHATGAMAIYGFIAYAVSRSVPAGPRRFEVAFWAGVFVLMIGFSRVFLHVHYPSDVLGGFLAGTLWLIVGIAITEWIAQTDAAARRHAGDGTS